MKSSPRFPVFFRHGLAVLIACSAPGGLAARDYESFEARQCHPVDRHGSVLLAVNPGINTVWIAPVSRYGTDFPAQRIAIRRN